MPHTDTEKSAHFFDHRRPRRLTTTSALTMLSMLASMSALEAQAQEPAVPRADGSTAVETIITVEKIVIPIGQQNSETSNTSGQTSTLPDKGLSMAEVNARWGQPEDIGKARGKPPITRWRYADFTVYFENSTVIHAVRHPNLMDP
ncbi:MAG: hypothetical protein MI864_12615 [Pseudomonadales bacterium]|uniref:Uncharacterized protein n=1 Tax=Oleiphilus messinensis TaxID=141451 RepID=A0A1Y0I6S6_9GAMM|nr:hypothetical protein [Oleiphilus messinensis]ARU56141.1 hypothetical protein OLMES_2068 [Oleiphilus messinensis]MCG8611368.1 hypothetical protein [Pseudomonadales bacterium]